MATLFTTTEERKTISADGLIRWMGLSAILAGSLFIAIQLIHPPDQLSSVRTSSWLVVSGLTSLMSFSSLIGTVGIYTKQIKESGWLGLVGTLIFSLFWLASLIFSFIEALVLPVLIDEAPEFVEGFLGIFGGYSTGADLGFLPLLAPLAGGMYILGGVLLGFAIIRAKVLPRLAGVFLVFSAVATLGASIIPHPYDRVLAVPMGLTLIWLGYLLWSRRKKNILL